jgi:ATP-dependent Clp protease ATP-binding subunit ClpB
MKAVVLSLLRQYFRPEFLNRVDEILVFRALEREQIGAIATLLLQRLAVRVEQGAGITLQWDEAVVDYLADLGYEPAFGARPLKRALQNAVETPLSRRIVSGEIAAGGNIILHRGPAGLEFRRGS